MGSAMTIALVTVKEYLYNKWVLGYAAGIALIASALMLSVMYLVGGFAGVELYGRLGASIVAASLMLSSLVSITFPTLIVTSDYEIGALEWFLSRPVKPSGYLLGRYLGISTVVAWATLLGYVASSLAALVFGIPVADRLMLMGIINSLIVYSLSGLGILIAVATANRVAAVSAAFAAWLYFNMIHPLTVLAAEAVLGLGYVDAYIALILSPVEAARILIYGLVDPSLTFLGPVASVSIRLEMGEWIYAAPATSLVAYLAGSLAYSLASAHKLLR